MEIFVHKISTISFTIFLGYFIGYAKIGFCQGHCMLSLIRGGGLEGHLIYPKDPAKLSASSTLSPVDFYSPEHAFINTVESLQNSGGWVAEHNTAGEYIQAEFPGLRRVETIWTRGRHGFTPPQYVRSYRVFYSRDCIQFDTVNDNDDNPLIFPGNSNNDGNQFNSLPYLVQAKCIRINPVSWNNHIALRFEVDGCDNCERVALPNGRGEVSLANATTTVKLICNDDFEHIGGDTFSCLANGSWSKEMPYCIYQGCGPKAQNQTILEGGSATFVIGDNSNVWFNHLPELRKPKCITRIWSHDIFDYEDDSYRDRLTTSGNMSFLILKLNGMHANDSGMYYATRWFDTILCFHVTVRGPISKPVITALSETGGFEEYTTGRFSCLRYSNVSSNGEEFHNKTEYALPALSTVEWRLGGLAVSGNWRCKQHGHDLEIADLTRNDVQALESLSCYITDSNSGTYSSIRPFELQIFYGPDNIVLSPPNIFYILDDGDAVPNISCKADCNPPCNISWTKFGERGMLTAIGTRTSVFGANERTPGIYVCHATRNGSTAFRSQSIVVQLKEKPTTTATIDTSEKITTLNGTNSHDSMTGIVGGLLGAILLLVSAAFITFCCVIYRRQQSDSACLSFRTRRNKGDNSDTSNLRNMNGSRSPHDPNGSEAASNNDNRGTDYSELNMRTRNIQIYESINTGFTDDTAESAAEYENNRLRV